MPSLSVSNRTTITVPLVWRALSVPGVAGATYQFVALNTTFGAWGQSLESGSTPITCR
ncbi:MAG: hypothetical protein BWX54_02104 [Verrucomicrobia bacterium ADurb.Bin018]|nr:MAG: hypothetical protein BWX54_02104 [Verrucomicrobia bacterium ADurb.Bin018]